MKKATPKSSPNHTQALYTDIQSALAVIPSEHYDTWFKVAASLQSAGVSFDLFDTWSSTAPDVYSQKACRNVWRSLDHNGAISVATLFHIAKQYGFEPHRQHDLTAITPRPNNADQESKRKRRAERASIRAENILNSCRYADANHPYFVAKRIKQPVEIWQHGNRLIIPVCDIHGNIHSLQSISPNGTKKFLPGGQIKGNFYQMWSDEKRASITICEGYATAATIHNHFTKHTSLFVAFNAGNIKPVALKLREYFPAANIMIAGDNDASGVGQRAAEEAALAVDGHVAIPTFKEGETGSDWNDRWLLDYKGAA